MYFEVLMKLIDTPSSFNYALHRTWGLQFSSQILLTYFWRCVVYNHTAVIDYISVGVNVAGFRAPLDSLYAYLTEKISLYHNWYQRHEIYTDKSGL